MMNTCRYHQVMPDDKSENVNLDQEVMTTMTTEEEVSLQYHTPLQSPAKSSLMIGIVDDDGHHHHCSSPPPIQRSNDSTKNNVSTASSSSSSSFYCTSLDLLSTNLDLVSSVSSPINQLIDTDDQLSTSTSTTTTTDSSTLVENSSVITVDWKQQQKQPHQSNTTTNVQQCTSMLIDQLQLLQTQLCQLDHFEQQLRTTGLQLHLFAEKIRKKLVNLLNIAAANNNEQLATAQNQHQLQLQYVTPKKQLSRDVQTQTEFLLPPTVDSLPSPSNLALGHHHQQQQLSCTSPPPSAVEINGKMTLNHLHHQYLQLPVTKLHQKPPQPLPLPPPLPPQPLNEQIKHKLRKLPALVKGYLVRKLMQTDKVQQLKRTITDTSLVLIRFKSNLIRDAGGGGQKLVVTHQDILLHQRLCVQLEHSCNELYGIFFHTSKAKQMSLIAKHREYIKYLNYQRHRRQRDHHCSNNSNNSRSSSAQSSVFGCDGGFGGTTTKRQPGNSKQIFKQQSPLPPNRRRLCQT